MISTQQLSGYGWTTNLLKGFGVRKRLAGKCKFFQIYHLCKIPVTIKETLINTTDMLSVFAWHISALLHPYIK